MSQLLKTLFFFFLVVNTFAQAPTSFHYQAVLRDPSGYTIPSRKVNFRMSIVSKSPTGNVIYGEVHSVTTNKFGVVDIAVGTGTRVAGTGKMENINWGNVSTFLRVEVDLKGGEAYELMGTTQLLSVPYAFHAKTADNGFSGDYNDLKNKPDLTALDNSATNEIQVLSKSGNTVSLSKGGGSFVLPTITAGNGITISSNNQISVTPETKVKVGDIAHGGIVFFVNSAGTHGLVINQKYQGTANWYDAHNLVQNPALTGGEFTDWRLPSLAEMQIIQSSMVNAGRLGVSSGKHWTGTESIAKSDARPEEGNGAINFTFSTFNGIGFNTFQEPKSSKLNVRAVRSF